MFGGPSWPQDDFDPKLGRIRDAGGAHHAQAHDAPCSGKPARPAPAPCGSEATSRRPPKRGMGAGVRAAAGLIAPGSRRVIVKARYTRIVAGDLGAARAHLKYIVRDGVTREGAPGQLYDATAMRSTARLPRSLGAATRTSSASSSRAEDSARLADLKPFIRDLLAPDGARPRHQARLGGGRSFQHRPSRTPTSSSAAATTRGGTWSWRATTSAMACAPAPRP